jgi:flagellar biosynthesis/type III secretory pathway chaperone
VSDSVDIMIAALEQELLTLTSLHEALQRESSALSGGNATDIDAAIAAKNESLQAHQAQMSRRPADDVSEAVKADLQPMQDRLAALAGECQELNRRNGALISKLSDRTKAALSVLQGTEDMTVLYSVSGVEGASGKGSRVLGKA